MVSHYLAMFGGLWSSASEDTRFLICNVTLQNHMIQGSRNFISASSSWYIITLPDLMAIGIVIVEI